MIRGLVLEGVEGRASSAARRACAGVACVGEWKNEAKGDAGVGGSSAASWVESEEMCVHASTPESIITLAFTGGGRAWCICLTSTILIVRPLAFFFGAVPSFGVDFGSVRTTVSQSSLEDVEELSSGASSPCSSSSRICSMVKIYFATFSIFTSPSFPSISPVAFLSSCLSRSVGKCKKASCRKPSGELNECWEDDVSDAELVAIVYCRSVLEWWGR